MPRNPLSQLATLGEEAIEKATGSPAAAKAARESVNRLRDQAVKLKDRADELQRQVLGLQKLERRLALVEERLEALERDKAERPAKRTAGSKRPTI